MMNLTNAFVTVENNQLLAYPNGGDAAIVITRENAYLLADVAFSVSSSIDFPEEYTTDADVLALVKELF